MARFRVFTIVSVLALAACANEEAASASGQNAARSAPKGGGDAALQERAQSPAPLGETALSVETVAEGLVNPWCVAFLPNGDILVTERAGRLRVIRDGALLEAPVRGVPKVYAENQAGLFDILPHPDFAENRTVFLSYAHGTADENATRVARATFDGEVLNDLEVIYEATPMKAGGYHYGGKIVFADDGTLFITIGEGSRYKEKAQDMTSSFGAVVRINQDGSIPEGNADFGDNAPPELWTKGHRNPQGLAWDAGRRILWSNEHGPRGGDEINIIERGGNYGWPLASYGIDYSGAKITPFTEYEGTKQPFKYWTPSIGVSGLAVYSGDVFPGWNGDLLAGGMARPALHRIILDEAGNETGEERYLEGERVRDVRIGPDGAIYVTTEDRGGAPVGKVLRLTRQ